MPPAPMRSHFSALTAENCERTRERRAGMGFAGPA
jgi:hypothetical protein